MRPIRIEGAEDKPIGAPADWDEATHGHCQALFVRREVIDGVPYMRSAHEIDGGDTLAMLAGASLELGIQGSTHPVIQLAPGPVPQEFEPVMQARCYTAADARPMVRVEMMFPSQPGRMVFSNTHIDGTLADAVSIGITNIQSFARAQGWTE